MENKYLTKIAVAAKEKSEKQRENERTEAGASFLGGATGATLGHKAYGKGWSKTPGGAVASLVGPIAGIWAGSKVGRKLMKDHNKKASYFYKPNEDEKRVNSLIQHSSNKSNIKALKHGTIGAIGGAGVGAGVGLVAGALTHKQSLPAMGYGASIGAYLGGAGGAIHGGQTGWREGAQEFLKKHYDLKKPSHKKEASIEKSAGKVEALKEKAKKVWQATKGHGKSLVDDVKGLAGGKNSAGRSKSKSFHLKSMARNPVAQAGAGAAAGGAGIAAYKHKKNKHGKK